jgi:threonine synthase
MMKPSVADGHAGNRASGEVPDAVKQACGIDPALPSWLSDLMQREERFSVVPNEQEKVESHIQSHTRATR